MTTRAEGRGDGAFNELVALLLRNEDGEKHAADVEMDMRRLLMLACDTHLREQFVQVQGVRRVTRIAKAATNIATQRICAGILGNLAHSERGCLSASSCDRWNCVSHRHQCPLSKLLANTNSDDDDLARISAAALLAFSTQNHCQRHLDTLSGIPVLLRLLDVKQDDGAATDVAIYAAATLWNMCKAPALLLNLETIYGVLRDQLTRKLSNLLITPLEPFELFLTPTGERGMPVLLEFDGDNLNVLVTASISTQLHVVLSIQNYVGRVRTLTDQFRPKTPTTSAVMARSRTHSGIQTGISIAHYDESGMLASRTCAVCAKLIPLKPSKRKRARPSLQCSREDCGQMYHLSCSRWATLSEEAIASITSGKLDVNFYCDVCMLGKPLCYWDFLSVSITRVQLALPKFQTDPESERSQSKSSSTEAGQHQDADRIATKIIPEFEEEDRSPWPAIMLFDRNSNLVGVGDKCFRISASSRDPEMYIVMVKYVTIRCYPATRQERTIPQKGEGSTNSTTTHSLSCKWEVTYARHGAVDLAITPGNAIFWPASFTHEALALEYTRRSLYEMENAFLYEFQGEHPHDKMFSIGNSSLNQLVASESTANPIPLEAQSLNSIWMALTPRKGICMKLLATQIGHLKKLQEVHILQTKPDKSKASKANRKLRKPHFPGQQLNKIAVDTTQ